MKFSTFPLCRSSKITGKALTHSIWEFNPFNVRLKGKHWIKLNFPVDSWTVFEFVAVKKFGKELGNDDHQISMDRTVLISYGKIITKVFTCSVRIKYTVCSPTKVVLNLTELVSSTVWRSFHSLAEKKLFEELHRAEYIVAWFSDGPGRSRFLSRALSLPANDLDRLRIRLWILKLDLISESLSYIFRSAKSQKRH